MHNNAICLINKPDKTSRMLHVLYTAVNKTEAEYDLKEFNDNVFSHFLIGIFLSFLIILQWEFSRLLKLSL